MFCPECGHEISEGLQVCPYCKATFAQPAYEAGGAPSRPGWSDKINDPEMRAEVDKANRSLVGCLLVMLVVPVALLLAGSLVADEIDLEVALVASGCVCVVVLVMYLIARLRQKTARPWDGTVIDQYEREKTIHESDDDGNTWTEHHYLWITEFRTDRGKYKKLEERDETHPFYDYLDVGDRVRCHPELLYGYEKFDKTHDTYLVCPFCGWTSAVREERCTHCHKPLLR